MKITAFTEEYAYRLATGAITAGSTAGGDLSGAFPSPTVSGIAGVAFASNNPQTLSLYTAIPVTTGSNTAAWMALSSNTPINVSDVGNPGGGPMPGFWDHIHGVSFGSNATTVSSVSAPGASPSNSRADHVHAGVASVAVASNTFAGPLTFTTPGNSVGITSPAPGTLAFTASGGGGSGGGGSGGGISSGTVFPGSPASGGLFFRTDRGLLYFWDGARWLTTDQRTVTLADLDVLAPFMAAGGTIVGAVLATPASMYLDDLHVSLITTTTNGNGSNYWTLTLEFRDSTNTSQTITGTPAVSTAADTLSSVTALVKTASIGQVLSANARMLVLTLGKTGAPNGGVYPAGVVRYRMIG